MHTAITEMMVEGNMVAQVQLVEALTQTENIYYTTFQPQPNLDTCMSAIRYEQLQISMHWTIEKCALVVPKLLQTLQTRS